MADKKNVRTYALIAVGVALVACVAAVVIALLLGLNALGWFTPKNIGPWKQGLWFSVAFIIIGISLYGILQPDQVRRFLSGRQARYGSNSLILLVALLGIIVMVNMLAFNNPVTVADMTASKAHTLAPETIQLLASLPEKVNATAYFTANSSTTQANELLTNFKSKSDGKFDFRFADPDSDPVTVREAGITGDGKILLTMGDRREVASYAEETELVRALNRLVHPGARVVYFLSGHGEADITATGDAALSVAKAALEGKNYTVQSLNLLTDNKIPDDALAIIIAGPLKPISAQEVDLLKKFVAKGGGLVIAEDPTPITQFGNSPDPLADYLKTDWGIVLDNDIVIDLTNSGNELNAVTRLSTNHPITLGMRSMNQVAILPNTRSLSLGAAPEGVTVTSLAQTTADSWGETDFANLQGTRVQFDQGTDLLGPLSLGMAGETTANRGRVVVFGNSSFFLDINFDKYGNGDFFINAVDWAAAQENQVTLTPYNSTERTLKVVSPAAWLLILFVSVFILPGLIVIAGAVSWFARRRRG